MYPYRKESTLNTIFWPYLFMPDLISRLLLVSSAELSGTDTFSLFYGSAVFLVYISCLFMPLLYVITWVKSNKYMGDPILATLAKLYVILSAASSNFAYMVIGQGTL